MAIGAPGVAGYPSSTNVFVASPEATAGMIVGFSRSPDRFRLSDYIKYTPVTKLVGLFGRLGSDQGARLISADDVEHLWPDGHDAPGGAEAMDSFQYEPYYCKRRVYPFTLGDLILENADWAILAVHSAEAASLAMTSRTSRVLQALRQATWGTHTKTAVQILGAGKTWANGSTGVGGENGPHIKKCLNAASIAIGKDSLSTIKGMEQPLVVNPATAAAMAESAEIQDYIKQSPFALAQLRGDQPSQNGNYGLPDTLYNHPLVIEDCVRVTTRKGNATVTRDYALADGEAFLLSRPGGVEGVAGAPSFSTIEAFIYKDELTVETMHDPNNRLTRGRVVVCDDPHVLNVTSGFYFPNVLS